MRVAIIGGGPSGLVTLKYLSTAENYFATKPIEVKLFESAEQIGGVFFHHSYEDGVMVSSKYYTAFSDFRLLPDDKDFLSTDRYLKYLNEYSTFYNLWPHINLGTSVVSVRRRETGGHIVTYKKGDAPEEEWECDAIAVCSGLHETPNIPALQGVENIPTVIHSVDFKSREQFGVGTTVVILGAGETAFDIGHLAVTAPTKKVVMCHRNGFWTVPKKIPTINLFPWRKSADKEEFAEDTIPIDIAGNSLFDTMYVHPGVRDSMIVWNFHDVYELRIGSSSATGSRSYNQYVARVPDARLGQAHTILNKAYDRVGEYMVYPWYARWAENASLVERIRRWFVDIPRKDPGKYIDIAPWPSHIDDEGMMHFIPDESPEYALISEQTIKPDVLIFATGYTQKVPFLEPGYPTPRQASTRGVWAPDSPDVAFIGFVRPGLGAIPALAEMQAMLWTSQLLGRITPGSLSPADEWHMHVLAPPSARTEAYGVDHESYAWQLAKDVGVAPGLSDVLGIARAEFRAGHYSRAWRLPIVWALGVHVMPKFRLVGPWKTQEAVGVMTGEIWETIQRRKGPYGNFYKAVIPMMYLGSWSLIYWIWFSFLKVLTSLRVISEHNAKPRQRFWHSGMDNRIDGAHGAELKH